MNPTTKAEEIQYAPLMVGDRGIARVSKRITRKKLARFQEQVLLDHTPAILPEFFNALLRGLEKNDKDCMRLAAEIYKLVQGRDGISIVNKITNHNQNANVAPSGRGFEATIRRLEQRDRESNREKVIEVLPE